MWELVIPTALFVLGVIAGRLWARRQWMLLPFTPASRRDRKDLAELQGVAQSREAKKRLQNLDVNSPHLTLAQVFREEELGLEAETMEWAKEKGLFKDE